jgi:periplasmic protein TonB
VKGRSAKRVARVLLAVCAMTNASISTAIGQDKVIQVSEQELRAAASRKIEPEYPAVARQIHLTGDVEIEVSVDSSGTVESATVERGNTLLAGPSLQAIKKWKFSPFREGSQPVRAVGTIRFTFRI